MKIGTNGTMKNLGPLYDGTKCKVVEIKKDKEGEIITVEQTQALRGHPAGIKWDLARYEFQPE